MSPRTAQRRHQAIDQYLADDKVEDICRQLVCAKSWRYKWRDRYDAHNPAWAQERSTRPKSPPTQTPANGARAVVSLHVTLMPTTAQVVALRPSCKRSPSKGESPCPPDEPCIVLYAAITRR